MLEPEQTLVLTRPEAQSQSFLSACERRLGQKMPAVVSPVFQIIPVYQTLKLDRFNTIIITSQNALNHVDLAGRNVVTVGQRTAEMAISLGADAVCLGENVEMFLRNATQIVSPAIHLRGEHTRGDLAARMVAGGCRVDEAVVYRQCEQPLSNEAKLALRRGKAIVPVFSPRSAKLVSKASVDASTQVFAISAATADEWNAPGQISLAERPDFDAMVELVINAW